jgi:hypothetical protein
MIPRFLDAGTITHASATDGENRRRLATKVGEEPENERKAETENEASDDGEIEGCVFATVDNVARKFSNTERNFSAEIEKSADDREEAAKEEEGTTEFAERIHKSIIEE